MTREPWLTIVVRLLLLTAFACGVIGLVAGLTERQLRLGVTGWFTGGILLAVLALIVLVETYLQARNEELGYRG